MDKVIEKKKGIAAAFTKKAAPYWLGGVVVLFFLWLLVRDNQSVLRVNSQTLSMGQVTRGEFNDYIRVTGQVMPMTTIQISPLEGGVVETIVAEEGSKVKKGDVILILNNESLDLQILVLDLDVDLLVDLGKYSCFFVIIIHSLCGNHFRYRKISPILSTYTAK